MSEHSLNPGWRVARIVGLTMAGIVGAVVIAFLFGYFVMLLWNWLMPPLFHVGTINYWQAFGLVILAKILFGGFGSGHSPHPEHDGWKKEARRWERWGGPCGPGSWKGPRRWEDDKDDWAPKGSHRNWRFYGRYWRDEGRAAFEAWLDKQDKDRSPDQSPDQPKAE